MTSARNIVVLLTLGSLCSTLTGCLVAGYSAGGGFFIWPGSIIVTILLILFFVLRRSR